MSEKIIVIYSSYGQIEKLEEFIVNDVSSFVKKLAKEALEEWDTLSDFIIMKDFYMIVLDLPLNSNEYEKLRKYGLRRKGNVAVAEIPLFEISNKNKWSDKGVEIYNLILIAPSISRRINEELISYAKEMTRILSY